MSSTRHLIALAAITALLTAATTAPAAPALPANLQLGAVPLLPDGGGWSMAVPLDVAPDVCRLESSSSALRLVAAPDGREAWLILAPTEAGPVSGFLEIGSGATARRIAVSGEVVATDGTDLPPVLVVSADGSRRERRFLRMTGLPAPTSCALERADSRLGAPVGDGWIPIDILPRPGLAEDSGLLLCGDGSLEIALRYSVAENITVLAQGDLPEGWSHAALLRFRETLEETGLRARVALLGRRAGTPAVRLFDLSHDRFTGRHRLRPRYLREVPGYEGGFLGARAIRLQDPDGAPGARKARFVTLTGETAALWDPSEGLLVRDRAAGLRAGRAVATSLRKRNAIFAVRTDVRSGRHYLRRWRAADNGGNLALRGRIAELPLEARLGVRRLQPFALRARLDVAGWPEIPATERLLLLAADAGFAKGAFPVSLYSLILDPDDPSRIVSARRSLRTRLRWAQGDPAPYLRYAAGPLAGAGGYPARAEIGIPGLTPGRRIDITGLGDRFRGSPYIAAVRHDVSGGAFGFEVPVFLGATGGENGTAVRRYRYVDGEVALRASGQLPQVRPVAMEPSKRMRHAWAVTRDARGARKIRLLEAGIPGNLNLPPKVDAGADLRFGRRLVELRARAVDPDGDRLAIRWSAPGIEFGSPDAPVTTAYLPVGVTQVRVAVREQGGPLGAVDMIDVEVAPASAVDGRPALATRITGVFPNPANPRLQVAFTVDRTGPVRVEVHDVAGRLVRVLLDEVRSTGAWDVAWDGRDTAGSPVASGVYLVSLVADGRTDIRRGVIVR